MNDLVRFLNDRLTEDEAAAQAAEGAEWTFKEVDWLDFGDWLVEDQADETIVFRAVNHGTKDAAVHAGRHDPARVLREVAAKRRIMERHSHYDGTALYDYCAGCPTGDETGYPDTELKDCPELQDLAYVWNEHEDWDQQWCPHVEGRHEADITELPPARACYTNACNRCGQGDGWHYRDRSTT